MVTSYDAQAVPPKNCNCFDPRTLDPADNSTVPCNDTGCSRANNSDCYVGPDISIIYDRRAFLYGFDDYSVGFLVCNCPGFSYDAVAGPNGYFYAPPNTNAEVVVYNNCSDFKSADPLFANLTDCCNYCCRPLSSVLPK